MLAPDFIQLVRRKQKLYWSLSLAMLVIYYGFVLLVAFSPSTLGQSLSGGVTSVGMLVGVVIVLLAFASSIGATVARIVAQPEMRR